MTDHPSHPDVERVREALKLAYKFGAIPMAADLQAFERIVARLRRSQDQDWLGVMRVAAAARKWREVYVGPCGTPNCESPTCQLAYAVDALEARYAEAETNVSSVLRAAQDALSKDPE